MHSRPWIFKNLGGQQHLIGQVRIFRNSKIFSRDELPLSPIFHPYQNQDAGEFDIFTFHFFLFYAFRSVCLRNSRVYAIFSLHGWKWTDFIHITRLDRGNYGGRKNICSKIWKILDRARYHLFLRKHIPAFSYFPVWVFLRGTSLFIFGRGQIKKR